MTLKYIYIYIYLVAIVKLQIKQYLTSKLQEQSNEILNEQRFLSNVTFFSTIVKAKDYQLIQQYNNILYNYYNCLINLGQK